jgi:hypothetical protein
MKASDFSPADFDALSERLARGNITVATTQELEQYLIMLCRPDASQRLGSQQFPQACETIRLLLLRAHINTLERRNAKVQWWVIVLAVAALLSSIAQIFSPMLFRERPIASSPPAQAAPAANATQDQHQKSR